jgi:predicted RNA-binding protein associated with RNAse of E/G family
MSTAEIAELVAALRAGRLTLDEVAERFRHRAWGVARRPVPRTYAEMAAQLDVDADVPGSFDEVVAAYDRGELTREQYRTLAHAVAHAINAARRQES